MPRWNKRSGVPVDSILLPALSALPVLRFYLLLFYFLLLEHPSYFSTWIIPSVVLQGSDQGHLLQEVFPMYLLRTLITSHWRWGSEWDSVAAEF